MPISVGSRSPLVGSAFTVTAGAAPGTTMEVAAAVVQLYSYTAVANMLAPLGQPQVAAMKQGEMGCPFVPLAPSALTCLGNCCDNIERATQ